MVGKMAAKMAETKADLMVELLAVEMAEMKVA